jgi:hypothetical protein
MGNVSPSEAILEIGSATYFLLKRSKNGRCHSQYRGVESERIVACGTSRRQYFCVENQLATHQAELDGDGAIAQGPGEKAVGQDGILLKGGMNGNLLIGAKIEKLEVIIENAKRKSLPFPEALTKYLTNIIANHQSHANNPSKSTR